MARKDSLNVGDKVRALRTHNKAVAVEGTITRIHDGTDDCVDIKLSAAGTAGQVLTPVEHEVYETVHASDVAVLERGKAKT